MSAVVLLLQTLAFASFAVAAVWGRNLVALGLALFTLVYVLRGFGLV